MFLKKKNTTNEDAKKSNKKDLVITVPHCEANVRYARNFKYCSDWEWDKDHKNITVKFEDESGFNLFTRMTEKKVDPENYCAVTAAKVLDDVKANGAFWDIYFNEQGNIVATRTTKDIEIHIIEKYFSGFGEDEDDVFHILIKSKGTNGKHVSIGRDNVSNYIQEDLYNALVSTMWDREEGLFNAVQYELDKLCGK